LTNIPDIFSKIPSINAQTAVDRLCGETNLLIKLIFQFLDAYTDIINQITTAVNNEKYDEAIRLSHRLKGTAAQISATDVHHWALECEVCLKKNDLSKFKGALEKLKIALNQFFTEADDLKKFYKAPCGPLDA